MKSTKFTIACLIAVGVVAFASCKKKTDDSVHARLSAKWKAYKTAVDMNANGVLDAGDEVDTTSNASYITFSSDGTGKTEGTTSADNSTFTWTLKNNDADVVIKETSGSSSGSQETLHIDQLTSTDLNISQVDSASTFKVWIMMKKQ